jgi:hypothetical protein
MQGIMESKSASEQWNTLKLKAEKGEINPFVAAQTFWDLFRRNIQ